MCGMDVQTNDIRGKVMLITGATSGIGKATAVGLAQMGANIVMVGRNRDRLESTRQEMENLPNIGQLDTIRCDLSSMQGVRSLADDFRDRNERLDVLINCAGGIMKERMMTVDGYEYTFALDHLSPFLLTNLLLDTLKASAPSRVVTIATSAFNPGHINFEDLMYEKNWKPFKTYCQAKLANVLFTYELARRLEGTGVTANCLHPGAVRSNFGKDQKGLARIVTVLLSPAGISPEKGARTPIFLASSSQVEKANGKFFFKTKERRSPKESYDEEVAKRLWKISEELTGL
jgi:retinol dehydrogenase-14